MSDLAINFERPWLLLLIIPVLLISLIPHFLLHKRYRNTRNRVISVIMHTVASVLCVLLISGMSFSYNLNSKNNEIMILVDRSDSESGAADARDEFLAAVINSCDKNYKLGIVTFGYDTVYAYPLSYDKREAYRSYLAAKEPEAGATDIAGAIAFAAEQFKHPKTAKILILSDGFETDGEAKSAARLAAAKGIKIDAAGFGSKLSDSEVQLIGAKMPEDRIVPGQETTLSVTVRTNLKEEGIFTLNVFDMGYKSGSYQITLTGGTQTVDVKHTFQSAGFHDVTFTIEGNADADKRNNSYFSYINIPVLEKILIIENNAGEADALTGILSTTCTVDVLNIHDGADFFPRDLHSLAQYDEVLLVNISNADLTSDMVPKDFMQNLYTYVYNVGGGLFTVGGQNDYAEDGRTQIPHAYNRRDMQGSLLQQMLPVQVIEYKPPIAVMIVIDTSGSMSMGRYEAALSAATEIVDSLSSRDYCGITTFDSSSKENISVIPVSQKDRLLDEIKSLKSTSSSGSGGTVFSGAIELAGRSLAPIPVERRHIVLLTDGNPSDNLDPADANDKNTYGKYIQDNFRQNNITMSIFALGMTSGSRENLEKAAKEYGHGQFFDIPLGEVDRVAAYAKSDMAEIELAEFRDGLTFRPSVRDQSTAINGITSTTVIPTLSGYYGTKLKDGAKAPLIYDYVPIYAEWSFGAGRVGSFMCDLGGSWSADFVADSVGMMIVTNIADSLAPADELQPDKLDMVIRESGENYRNRIDIYTKLLEGESIHVGVKPLSDAADRFYGGDVPVTSLGDNVSFTFDIKTGGVYRITVEKRDTAGNTTAECSVIKLFSYSEEYNAFRTEGDGDKLLTSLTSSVGGTVVTDPIEVYSTFEKTYSSTTDPRMTFLIVAIVCVLIDVAVRKFKFKWPHEIIRERRISAAAGAGEKNGAGEKDAK